MAVAVEQMFAVPADVDLEAASSREDSRERWPRRLRQAQEVIVAGNNDGPIFLDERAVSDIGKGDDGGGDCSGFGGPGGDGSDAGREGSCTSRFERRAADSKWWGGRGGSEEAALAASAGQAAMAKEAESGGEDSAAASAVVAARMVAVPVDVDPEKPAVGRTVERWPRLFRRLGQ